MGQEETVPATVVFSWEHEPGVSKQSPWTRKAVVEADDMPENPRKAQAPARRLSVPPPPGRASMPVTRSSSRARAVRPEDDPFLAAYLACTKSTKTSGGGGAGETKGQRRFTWARLGLSCKSSNGVVEESMVKLSKLPEVHPSDA